MSDPRRLRVDNPVAGALLDAARGYSAPTEMRRRVLGSLGLPAAAASAAVAGSTTSGLMSGTLGKTLMTLAALATVGGGLAGYRSSRSREVPAAERQVASAPRPMLAGEPTIVPPAADHGPAAAARGTPSLVAAANVMASVAAEPRQAPRAPVTEPASGRPSVAAAHRAAVTVAATSVGVGVGVGAMAPANANANAGATTPSPIAGATGIVRSPPAAADLPAALADEVALLDQVEASLRRQAYKKALAQLEDHDRRFPDGVLAQEASVLAIEARVGIGDRAGAETRARQFLDRHGDGILAARVRSMIAARAR